MRIVIEITADNGTTFEVSLWSDYGYMGIGDWTCPPAFLLTWAGTFRSVSGDLWLFADDPGYLLTDIDDADAQALLKGFKPETKASGTVIIYRQGPLGAQLNFKQKWKVKEATGVSDISWMQPKTPWELYEGMKKTH
jgi:hypothetical protein